MKAAQISEYGNAEKVKIVDVDIPVVQDGQVLVEVHAASLNPFDTMVREGYVKDAIKALPITLGGDIAGVVKEVGSGVDHISVGETIYGQANVVAGNSGALAEFAVTKAGQVAHAPKNISISEAASLPLVAVSAYQALVEHLKVTAGQRILIHGGSGGIGSIAVQLAKHLGLQVTASVRTDDDVSFVKDLGAEEVINSENQSITELRDFDAVFDTVGDDFTALLGGLKSGGTAVSMIAQADETKARELGVTAITQSTQITAEKLDAISKLVEAEKIKPHVGKVFSLDDIVAAFKARESGAVRGKIVIQIKQ